MDVEDGEQIEVDPRDMHGVYITKFNQCIC